MAHSLVIKAFKIPGNVKQLASIAYANGGVLATDYVLLGHTANGMYYEKFLQEKLRPAIRKKRAAPKYAGQCRFMTTLRRKN